MTDENIIELLFQRDEKAIAEMQQKYSPYCLKTAGGILCSAEDREECLNDALLGVWNSVPPVRPKNLRLYLVRAVRNLAFNRYKAQRAVKRGAGEIEAALDELSECALAESAEHEFFASELSAAINRFVRSLSIRERGLFAARYFYTLSMAEIASRFNISENNASVILSRTRKSLKKFLQQEGF